MKPNLNSFVIGDPKKCIGCRSCEVACAVAHSENNTGLTVGTMESPIIPRLFYLKNNNSVMEVQCRHCERCTLCKCMSS